MKNSIANPFNPPLTLHDHNRLKWGNLSGSILSLSIANAARLANQLIVVIVPDTLSCLRLQDELAFFLKNDTEIPIIYFSDREILPYDVFSPHPDIISERLMALYRLPHLQKGILLISCQTMMQRLLPRQFLEQTTFILDSGEQIELGDFKKRLIHSGYQNVAQVMEPGEFSLRGSIIDLFPMGSSTPFRIDLFDDVIDSIRRFDPDTQKSIDKIDHIRLLPAREFPLTKESITQFRQNWRTSFSGNPANSAIYENISNGLSAAGIESYLPLFYDNTNTFFDYLPASCVFIKCGDVENHFNQFWDDLNQRYEQYRYDQTRPLLPPSELFLNSNEIFQILKDFSQIQVNQDKSESQFAIKDDLSIDRHAKSPLHKLESFIKNTSKRILFCSESIGRRETLIELLNTININPMIINQWHEFLDSTDQLAITIAPLEETFQLNDPPLIVITESQIFGKQVMQPRQRKAKDQRIADAIVRDLIELKIGDPIVHIKHGIGRYLGLQTLDIDENKNEFLTLEYADGDKLYVPVTALDQISRYGGPDMEHPPLHKLGSKHWSKAKRNAIKKIRDIAAELLSIYAKRESQKGFAFDMIKEQYLNFTSAFPFETTPDQERAINDVMEDMHSSKMMDRLICGDVGFGKTEVAMRAAFVAVSNNKQVAILVPTTLLAQQHFQTFNDRFAKWPVRIGLLSRFLSPKDQKITLDKLSSGEIDIVIGTHRLLQKDIRFNNLELLIIDEEHRFGVKQKERVKELRSDVSILTLTATPIPRTLNMSLTGIRDLSIISTAPEKRLSIKTFVVERNNESIREAILRESLRGGQVYYLHNNVATIQRAAEQLREILPEVSIRVAHGQMHERELENVMSDFYHHRFSVLVCTTIIESGIDIPTANTIIIERADRFGLAQLHQLRGRVGRSHHQAYAYLIIPSIKLITKDAAKRLEAISSLEDLGAGFMLATHDLEIRGAGEILGEDQSGQIQAIGYSLYMELLNRAVKSLQSHEVFTDIDLEREEIEIDIHIPALIPDNYINDVQLRLIFYKRIANAKDDSALKELQIEMIDRFGLLPQPTKNIFSITQIRHRSKKLGIKKLEASSKGGKIYFDENPNVEPNYLIQLIQNNPERYGFHGSNGIRFSLGDDFQMEELISFIEELIDELTKHKLC